MKNTNSKAGVIVWFIVAILSFWGINSLKLPFWIWLVVNVIFTPIVCLIASFDASVRDREIESDPIGFQIREELKRKNDLIERQNKLLGK